MKVAAYLRVSTKRQAEEGYSYPEQHRRVEEMCEREGWQLYRAYGDPGVSAMDDRRDLEELLVGAARGEFDVVIFRDLDRVGRSLVHLHEIVTTLNDAGIRIINLQGRNVDLTTAEGRFQFNVLASAAQFERDKLRERVAFVTDARARDGKHHGRMLYGYVSGDGGVIVIEPSQAPVVRRIFSEYLAGRSQQQIANGLNADGIKPPNAQRWIQGQVSKMLANPGYSGRVRVNGQTYAGRHEAIIDRETWERVDSLRASRARQPGRRASGRHLFTKGTLVCACGAKMTPRTERRLGVKAYEAYVCRGQKEDPESTCTMPPVPRSAVDPAFFDWFMKARIDVEASSEAAATKLRSRVTETRALRADAERQEQIARERLDRVRRDYQDGKLDADDWREQRQQLTDEFDASTAKLQRLHDRERHLETEPLLTDSERAVLQRLGALRSQVVGTLHDAGAGDLDALRAAMAQVIDSAQLLPVPVEWQALVDGSRWVIVPHLHPSVVCDEASPRRADDSAPEPTVVPYNPGGLSTSVQRAAFPAPAHNDSNTLLIE